MFSQPPVIEKGCDTDSLGKLTKMDAHYIYEKTFVKLSLFAIFECGIFRIQMMIPFVFG